MSALNEQIIELLTELDKGNKAILKSIHEQSDKTISNSVSDDHKQIELMYLKLKNDIDKKNEEVVNTLSRKILKVNKQVTTNKKPSFFKNILILILSILLGFMTYLFYEYSGYKVNTSEATYYIRKDKKPTISKEWYLNWNNDLIILDNRDVIPKATNTKDFEIKN